LRSLAHVIGLVGAVLVVAACGSTTAGSNSQQASAGANCPSPGTRFPQLATAGTVTAASTGELTVHDNRKNSDVQVTYDPSSVTVRDGRQSGTVSELKTGDLVGIQGQTQSNGSVHATTILVRPAGAPAPGQGRGRGRRAACAQQSQMG
jgi:hypothetical protein